MSDFDDVTDVDISSLPDDFKLGAIYINQDDHVYANVCFDSQSIDWFKNNLQHVLDPMTRAQIWRYFWVMVRGEQCQMSSFEYLEFAQKQLAFETVE